jgi:hypothetical protein
MESGQGLLVCPEHRQFPDVRLRVMADEIRTSIFDLQLEVSVVGCQPCVKHLRDGEATAANYQCARRLLAAMTGVAIDLESEQPLFRHMSIIGAFHLEVGGPDSQFAISVGDSDSGFAIRDSGFGIRDSGFGIRDSRFGMRDPGSGIRD